MSRFIIQIIAYLTMTLDHIGLIFFDVNTVTYDILRYTGRLALPLFTFMVAEGYKHTHDVKKYLSRLLIPGILMEVFYLIGDVLFAVPKKPYLNIFLTLFVGLLILSLLKSKKTSSKFLAIIPLALVIITSCFYQNITIYGLAMPISLEYGLYGIGLILAFGLTDNKEYQIASSLLLTLFFCSPGIAEFLNLKALVLNSVAQGLGLLSLIFIYFYNGKQGYKLNKWFTYLYYPLHLGILFFISILLAL